MKQSATTKAALPERLSFKSCTIQGDDKDTVVLSSVWSGFDYSERRDRTQQFAAEMVLRWNAHEQMREALRYISMICDAGSEIEAKAEQALAQLERPA